MAEDQTPDPTSDDGGFALDRERLGHVRRALDAGDGAALAQLLDPLHPADIADILEHLDRKPRAALVRLYGAGFDGEILSELDESLREDVVGAMAPEVLAEAVRDLESDDVVDLIEDLETPQQEAILDALTAGDRVAVEQSLTYPEETAGRLMQREMVVAPEHWNVGQAIDHMRAHADLPDQFYHVIIVDPRMRPTGYVTLGRIMSHSRSTRLADLVDDSFRTIRASQDEEEVAYAFNHYHLISAPVVDADDRLVGVITIDDAMAILDEEHEEDILRLAGVGESRLLDGVFVTMKRRLPWLVVNLGTAALAALVIAQFEDTIAALVVLAVLMPIVATLGGNAGTQSLTVTVRGLATRDLTAANAWRVIRREAMVGVVNGLVLAVPLGLVTALIFGTFGIGAVIAAALVINLIVAALAGVMIPIVLEKLGVDPALASGTFVTTVTDVVGFFAFLGLAATVLI
ncbi:magnesium transporter [Sinisalibacter lacisalsi]|uniref:Magnesium transporter MgtE n=1 Tax=Sinisalibacter lacisalsi TaxID=1526570 RepID=A0ABQ1QGK2_9RHOB|nr:magnesium transporter [Sinisalibacter lacisalsi]GGD26781.1 magnesium transporter MgtE [Sinisalibacter lacisalsi]